MNKEKLNQKFQELCIQSLDKYILTFSQEDCLKDNIENNQDGVNVVEYICFTVEKILEESPNNFTQQTLGDLLSKIFLDQKYLHIQNLMHKHNNKSSSSLILIFYTLCLQFKNDQKLKFEEIMINLLNKKMIKLQMELDQEETEAKIYRDIFKNRYGFLCKNDKNSLEKYLSDLFLNNEFLSLCKIFSIQKTQTQKQSKTKIYASKLENNNQSSKKNNQKEQKIAQPERQRNQQQQEINQKEKQSQPTYKGNQSLFEKSNKKGKKYGTNQNSSCTSKSNKCTDIINYKDEYFMKKGSTYDMEKINRLSIRQSTTNRNIIQKTEKIKEQKRVIKSSIPLQMVKKRRRVKHDIGILNLKQFSAQHQNFFLNKDFFLDQLNDSMRNINNIESDNAENAERQSQDSSQILNRDQGTSFNFEKWNNGFNLQLIFLIMLNHKRKSYSENLCQIHGNEKQFFCLQENCMVDLCNLCLIFHREIHDESQTDALIQKKPEVLEITKQNLKQLLWVYEKEQKKIDSAINQREIVWQEMFKKISEKFNESKKFLESIIDSFMKELEEQLFQNYIYPAKQLALEDLINPLKQLKFKKEKIDQLVHNLSKNKYINEIIRYAFNKDIEKTQYELEQKIENLISSGGKIQPNYEKVTIEFQQNKLSEVYAQLQDFVQVNVNLKELLNESRQQKNRQYDQITSQIDIQQIQSQKEIMSRKGSSKKILQKKQSYNEFTPQKLFQQISQLHDEDILEQDIINQKPLEINFQNYFEEESIKILHFFESKTKNILYIDLDQQKQIIEAIKNKQTNEKIEFQKLELDIDFQIPRHHTSVISPEGYIVLLGGLIAEQEEDINFLNTSYILDWENETLVELTPMNYKKAGASAIYTCFGILVVGGIFDDFQVSKKCELYDIANDEWKEIQSLNEPCMTSTLCLINNDQVLKLGGKTDEENLCKTIEIYNFFDNQWTKLIIQEFPFYNLSSAVQIQDKKLLVFGGVDSSNMNKSKQVYEIDLQNLKNIKANRIQDDLPFEDGFACQQPVTINNMIFALQNISEDKINSIKNNDRKIICIYNKGIINLN